jgi:hypothetical protein
VTYVAETAALVRLAFTWEGAVGYTTYSMDNSNKKSVAADPQGEPETPERRRIGRIVHDDRGNASVRWHDAPANYRRQVFEIESEEPHGLKLEGKPRSFDPYSSSHPPQPKKSAAPKTDLRKLSEWIKQMRELEERKRKGEVG